MIVSLCKGRRCWKDFLVAPVAKETKFSCLPASRIVSSLCEHISQMVCFVLFKRPAREKKGEKGDEKVYAMLLKQLLNTDFAHSRLNIQHETCALLLLVNNRSSCYILKKITGTDLHVTFRNQRNKVLSTGIASAPRHVLPQKSPWMLMKIPPTFKLPAAGRDWGRHQKVSDPRTLKSRGLYREELTGSEEVSGWD